MDEIQKLIEQGVEVRFWKDKAEDAPCGCILIDNGVNESQGRGTDALKALSEAKKVLNSIRREVKAATKSKAKSKRS